MAENDFTADSMYFEEVEGEEGKTLTLEETLRNKFVALLQDRLVLPKKHELWMRVDGLLLIIIIVAYILRMYDLESQRNLKSL